jgi:hypothetical protein
MDKNYTPEQFVKDYLPNYEQKTKPIEKEVCKTLGKAKINTPFAERYVRIEMSNRFFYEALEEFALKVCEKQRTVIKNEVIEFANKKSAFDVVAVINNAGYPDINSIKI